MTVAGRRGFLIGTGIAAVGLGAGPAPAQRRTGASSPIRIGCLVALSGPQEVLGRPILDGAMIAADQVNEAGGLLGRPVEIVPYDVRADPTIALRGLREMTGLGVNLLCGVLSSTVGLALAPELQPAGATLITCAAASDKLTHEAYTPNLFRVTDETCMRNCAQARLMAERYPDVRRWGAIIPDVEYGASAYAAFRAGLQEAYPARTGRMPELAEPVVAHFGADEFGAEIAALQADGAEFLVPETLGAACPEHLWLGMTWYYGGYQKLPLGRQLYQEYVKRTGTMMPLGFVNAGHSAVLAYAAAIRKARATDTAPVISALRGLTFDTAKGPVTLRREDNQAVCDVNFIRIRSGAEAGLGNMDGARADVEVAEFVRYDGADVIEPPSPGRRVTYRGQG